MLDIFSLIQNITSLPQSTYFADLLGACSIEKNTYVLTNNTLTELPPPVSSAQNNTRLATIIPRRFIT